MAAFARPGGSSKPTYAMPPVDEDLEAQKGGSFVPEDFMYGASVEHCSAEIRNGFLRKVYGLLGAQLLATAMLAATFMFHEPSRNFALRSQPLVFLSFLTSLGFLFACHHFRDRHPVNLALLAGFTLSIAYTVAVACALYQAAGLGYIVLQAFLLTAAITISLSVYTLTSKKDFSFLGAGLFAALGALIIGGLLNAVLSWITGANAFHSGMALGLAFLGAIIFSLYIVYDTWLISKKMSPDQYVQATIALYLDIINLFLELLRILAYLNNGGRD